MIPSDWMVVCLQLHIKSKAVLSQTFNYKLIDKQNSSFKLYSDSCKSNIRSLLFKFNLLFTFNSEEIKLFQKIEIE